jgi:hypothetical protein
MFHFIRSFKITVRHEMLGGRIGKFLLLDNLKSFVTELASVLLGTDILIVFYGQINWNAFSNNIESMYTVNLPIL